MQTIWEMNTWRYDDLIDRPFYAQSQRMLVRLSDLAPGMAPIQFIDSGVGIRLNESVHTDLVSMKLSANDDYQVVFVLDGVELGHLKVKASGMDGDLHKVVLAVPPAVAAGGYDELRVYPLRGDWFYQLGDVDVNPNDPGKPAP
jgi:hypothetical protein